MKILIVEDSATVAAFVKAVLRAEPDMELLPVAADATTAVESALEQAPDLILMDVKLPDHDGVWAIEEIMAENPCPIVVLSGHLSASDRDITFEALRAGAVDVMPKPTSQERDSRAQFAKNLVCLVRLMSGARVIRRNRPLRRDALSPLSPGVPRKDFAGRRCVLLGASTGGPPLLHQILSNLPAPYPLPIAIVQHTLEVFDTTLAAWLSQTGHSVRVASPEQPFLSGSVILSPATGALVMTPEGQFVHQPDKDPNTAIDSLFSSAARVQGEGVLAVLMSGMGSDGARGLLDIRRANGLTLVQSPETCVVDGMPVAALSRGAAAHTLPPEDIIEILKALCELRGGVTFRSEPSAQPGKIHGGN